MVSKAKYMYSYIVLVVLTGACLGFWVVCKLIGAEDGSIEQGLQMI